MSESATSIDDLIPGENDIFNDAASDISVDEITATINSEIKKYKKTGNIEEEPVQPKSKKVHFEPPPQPQVPMIPVEECTQQLNKALEETKEKLKAHYQEQIGELEKQYQKDTEERSKKSKFFENYKTSLISVILFLLLSLTSFQNIILKLSPKIVQNSPVLKLIFLAVVFAVIQFTGSMFV
jgi:hypothetical protein